MTHEDVECVSPAEAAEIMHCSVYFMRTHAGEYGGFKLGNHRIRIPLANLRLVQRDSKRRLYRGK